MVSTTYLSGDDWGMIKICKNGIVLPTLFIIPSTAVNFTLRQPKGLQGAHWPHPSFSIAAHDAMTDTGLGWPGLAFLWKKRDF
jgi:hypothetical protein